MTRPRFEEQYFEDPNFAPGLKGGDEVSGYGYYSDYFPVIQAQLAALVELSEGETMLDAGCGKGALAEYARTCLQLDVTGCDISDYATRIARQRQGGKNTVRAACLALPFPDQSFDLVWSNGVLQYLSPDEARHSLAEIGRVTRMAAFVSNIAAAVQQEEWSHQDHMTRLYLRPSQWESLARQQGWTAVALPYEGESAILIVKQASPLLPLRMVDLSFEYMRRLGCLPRCPYNLDAFRRRFRP